MKRPLSPRQRARLTRRMVRTARVLRAAERAHQHERATELALRVTALGLLLGTLIVPPLRPLVAGIPDDELGEEPLVLVDGDQAIDDWLGL